LRMAGHATASAVLMIWIRRSAAIDIDPVKIAEAFPELVPPPMLVYED